MHLKLTVFVICLWGYIVESSAMESMRSVLHNNGGFSSTSDSHYIEIISFGEIKDVLKEVLDVSDDNSFMFLRPKSGITNKFINYLKNTVFFIGDATGVGYNEKFTFLVEKVNIMDLTHLRDCNEKRK